MTLVLICVVLYSILAMLALMEVQILMIERRLKNDSSTKKTNERSMSVHENRN